MYVANAGDGGSNYTGFRLGRSATCGTCGDRPWACPTARSPGDVLFNSTGTNLAGTRVGTSLIDSFRGQRRTAGWQAAPGSPYAAQGLGPFGSEFRPTNPRQLFVSNAHGGADVGTVSAFDVAGNGALSLDRRLALPRPPDRALLGRDQPRRQLPVRRQHRRRRASRSYRIAAAAR